MKLRILSVLLIFLLVTSIVIPPVAAEPAPLLVVANPVTIKLGFDGITFLVGIVAATEIGKQLGITWDGITEHLHNFASGLSQELNRAFAANEWLDITSPEGKAVMRATYECYLASGGSSGDKKKDDKWYFEAKKLFGKIKIKTERLDKTQAVEAMKQGKDIITLNEKLAKNVVIQFKGLHAKKIKKLKLKFEIHHRGKIGYFPHLHYYQQGDRLHCWVWKY